MKKVERYPLYVQTKHCLYAFVAKDKMYKIAMIGSNKNAGCTVDFYITRRMVLKHLNYYGGTIITEAEFKKMYDQLFASVFDRIVNP